MTNSASPIEQIQEIRSIMSRSSRFISLSGLSGIIAGLAALLGATAGYIYLGRRPFAEAPLAFLPGQGTFTTLSPIPFFTLTAMIVLLVALAGGILPTIRRAQQQGQPVWSPLSRRLLISLLIPLTAGGVFVLALYVQGVLTLIAPATLVFYGLSLVNAAKYTLGDIYYLGLMEMALGLIASFAPGYGLELWSLGFGVLHILYGISMWNRYERDETLSHA